MMKETKKDAIVAKEKKQSFIAKKDWNIFQNEERYDIKKGDDIVALGVPEKFYPNLKTEKVI